MTDHLLHRELTAGCARCQLIRDEIAAVGALNGLANASRRAAAANKALADITAVLSEATP